MLSVDMFLISDTLFVFLKFDDDANGGFFPVDILLPKSARLTDSSSLDAIGNNVQVCVCVCIRVNIKKNIR